jgi:hypothetical protein
LIGLFFNRDDALLKGKIAAFLVVKVHFCPIFSANQKKKLTLTPVAASDNRFTELIERDGQFRRWCFHGRPKVSNARLLEVSTGYLLENSTD